MTDDAQPTTEWDYPSPSGASASSLPSAPEPVQTQETPAGVEALAEVIHPHMKAVRDRGDYIVGPASDEAARAILAAGYRKVANDEDV